MRSLLLIVVLSGGCAFEDGQPWGKLEPTLTVMHDRPADRLDDQGRFITAADYAIDIQTMEIGVGGLVLQLGGEGASGPTTFDPAAPPAGYSLCHNGHCHAADGSLVDYEDIEAELNQPDGAAPDNNIRLTAETEVVPLGAEPVAIRLSDCPNQCFVGRGAMTGVQVPMTSIRLVGRVFDRRTGDAQRLPDDGVLVDETFPVGLVIRETASASFGREEPVAARVIVALIVPTQLFDELDFAAPLDASAHEAVVESFATHEELLVTIERTIERTEE